MKQEALEADPGDLFRSPSRISCLAWLSLHRRTEDEGRVLIASALQSAADLSVTATELLRAAPGWDDSLILWRANGTLPTRMVVHAPSPGGVQWVVLEFRMAP